MVEGLKEMAPELRFGEFGYDWLQQTLKGLAVSGFSNGVFNDPKKVGTGYKLVNVKNMYEGDSVNLDDLTLLEISKSEFSKNKVLYGDIFFTRSSLVKEGIAWSNVMLSSADNITYDGHLIKMSLNLNEIDPYFFSKLLKTSQLRRQLVARGKTGTMTTIGQEDIASVKVVLPKLKEQQKIASFLTAVDDKLNLQRKKRDALQTYKRGLMQKLFSQEIRFKKNDGSSFIEWSQLSINEMGKTYSGLTGKTAIDFGEGDKYITYKQVFGQSNIDVDSCSLVYIGNNEKQNLVLSGDVIFTTSSEVPSEVGFSSVLIVEPKESVYLNSFCFGVRMNSTNIIQPEFSSYLFRSQRYRKAVYPLAQGSTRYNLSKSSFLKIKLGIPCVEEQQKIANCLTAFDKKIEAVAQQITQLETFKKGLLQKMFV